MGGILIALSNTARCPTACINRHRCIALRLSIGINRIIILVHVGISYPNGFKNTLNGWDRRDWHDVNDFSAD
jgi:hypothetical protein